MNIPEGFVLVPVEPTEEMLSQEVTPVLCLGSNKNTRVIQWRNGMYKAMIAAAPPVELPAYDEAKEPFGYHYSFARVVMSDGPSNWVNEFDREKPAEFHFEDGRVKDFTPLYTRPSAVFDEAAELAACRDHWEKNPNCLFSDMWLGWKACAQSRDGSVSDE